MKKTLSLTLIFLLVITLVSCKKSETNNLLDFENISLNDKEVIYDGKTHNLEVTGNIEGINITYTNNNKVNVGSYLVTAKLTKEGYNSKTLEATLKISKAKFTNLTFNNKSVLYDGNIHEIKVTGELPNNTTITYHSNISGIENSASKVGTYIITATITNPNYETLQLEAILEIKNTSLLDFNNISFNNKEVIYDGKEHKIEVTGDIPIGTNIKYSSNISNITNVASKAGTYIITAVLTKEGYNPKTLQATLIIKDEELKEFSGLTFANETFEYDSFTKAIEVKGIPPLNTKITYKSEFTPQNNNQATNVGTYLIKAEITHPEYKTLFLEATLKITAKIKPSNIFVYNDEIYFNNALDNYKLYKITTDNTIVKVSNDIVSNMTVLNNNLTFISEGLINNSIKYIENEKVNTLLSNNLKYFVISNNYLYYANNASLSKSGIFKIDLNNLESDPQILFEGKASNLVLNDNKIYFINESENKNIYELNLNTNNISLLLNEKIEELVYYEDALYFNVKGLTNSYLAKYNLLTKKLIKLTNDNAKFITVHNNYVYYSNVDLLSSNLLGKGLYRVSAIKDNDSSLPGQLLVETNYNVSSLYANNNKIYYYNVEDKHLNSYDIINKDVKDLMKDYKLEETESSILLKKHELKQWNNRIYYINNYDSGHLYLYDTNTKENILYIASEIKSFTIIGDILYYNKVSFGINNDLYMINLIYGGEPIKISKNDTRNMVIYKNYLFYVRSNISGVGTAITKLNLETLEEEDVLDKNAYKLTIHDNKLYYILSSENGKLYAADILENGTLSNITQLTKENTSHYEIVGSKIYYREVGLIYKYLTTINLDGSSKTQIISGYDPYEFYILDGSIYFANDTALKGYGLYKANLDGSNITLLSDKIYATNMKKHNNYIYFYNVFNTGPNFFKGDSKLYRFNIETNKIELVQ